MKRRPPKKVGLHVEPRKERHAACAKQRRVKERREDNLTD
jgi:hypothetical protein